MGQRRELVLAQVVAGRVEVGEAALLLGLSERSVPVGCAREMVAAGPQALVHGNVGRRPAHGLDPQLARRVVTLATTGMLIQLDGSRHRWFGAQRRRTLEVGIRVRRQTTLSRRRITVPNRVQALRRGYVSAPLVQRAGDRGSPYT